MKRESIAIIAFTDRGEALARRIREVTGGEVFSSRGEDFSLREWTARQFPAREALVFVGAAGIAARASAPFLRGKAEDPAVIAADEGGQFVIPILSGHLGGANALAERIAAGIGGIPVITTATDRRGVFAVDLWARAQGMTVKQPDRIRQVSAKILAGEEIRIFCPWEIAGRVPEGVCLTDRPEEADVVVSCCRESGSALQLVPRFLQLGIGCRRGISKEQIEEAFQRFCMESGISEESVAGAASVDLKSQEPGLLAFCRSHGWEPVFYSAEELNRAEGEFTASEFVRETVGVDNVCERAAVLAAGISPDRTRILTLPGGAENRPVLTVRKTALGGVTFAAAEMALSLSWSTREKRPPRLSVVGIGPGAPGYMTASARRALAEADLICGYTLYADLIRPMFPGKEYYTTGMTGETARCRYALEQAAEGRRVALVCSGDAGIYGMAAPVLELAPGYPGVSVEILAGVTAAASGGALLGAPLGHDFCVISLSDRLTDWDVIAKRLRAAAEGDFAICLYNPASRHRPDYLERACRILRETLAPETVCGLVRNIGREGEGLQILTLEKLERTPADMFTTVFIGNSRTKRIGERMVTPRGYRIGERE